MLPNYEGEDSDDDLDWSTETRIFKEVFFGYDHDTNDYKGFPSGTSQDEPCSTTDDLKDNVAHWSSTKEDALFIKFDNDPKKKRMKLPTDELSYSGNYPLKSGPSKRIVSGKSIPTPSFAKDSIACQLVESSSQGITSNCFFMKRPAENKAREVDKIKSISSCVSQESSGNKDLVATDLAPHQSVENTINSSGLNNMAVNRLAWNTDSTNNLKPFLRNHVQELLRDAGWEIGRRKRKKIMGEYLYYTPWRRKPIRDFRRVWNLCGRKLYTDAKVFLEESSKQWDDITLLWSDLNSTILEIEREMNCKNRDAALARRWYRLDPFVNILLIDKKLDTLKAGKPVKARRTLVMGTFEDDVLLPSDYLYIYGNQFNEASKDQICDASVVNENALTVFSTEESGTKRSRQSTGFSKSCDTDYSCEYSDSCLFDVPITYENENIIRSWSEFTTPSHNQNNFSPSFCRSRLDFFEDIDLKAKQEKAIVCFEAVNTFNGPDTENVGRQNSYLVDISIKLMQEENPVKQVDEHLYGVSESKSASSLLGQLKGNNVQFLAMRKSKSFKPSTKNYSWKIKSSKSEPRKKYKSKKGSCRLVPRSLSQGNKQIEGESPMLNVKTVLSWLIDRGTISVGEAIQCVSTKDGNVVKDGRITRDGVLCKCCCLLLSLSKFKSHAAFRMTNPCLDLFLKFGKSYTTCQLEAWSAEYKDRENASKPVNEYLDPSDDKCGLCGDMGELICCDTCPSTFHQACLGTQELPEGSWYCMHCSCRVCGDLVDDKAILKSHIALTCLQCEHKYHMACLEEMGSVVPSDGRFCGQICQEVYTGLNSHIGIVHRLSKGFSYSLLKCTKRKYHRKVVALEAECNSKLAVALTIMEECFLPIVDSRTGIDMIPRVLYNWRSMYPRLNYNGFYTVVLEKDDMLFSVASIRIHGVAVAEMPLVATCTKYQRQGMFRRLLHSIEEMLKCLKVEKLVVSALPSLIETWTGSFGFTLMEDDERNSLRNLNLMVFPGTVWLKKRICECPETLHGHPSSSITYSLTENACFRKRPVTEPQRHSFGRSSTIEFSSKRESRQLDPKKMQMDHDEQHGSLYKHLLKLPWGKSESSVGRIRVDVSAARDTVLRMSQKAHTLQDTC